MNARWLCALMLVAGCTSPGTDDMGGGGDDLKRPGADLSSAGDDLMSPPDLKSPPPDLSVPPADLAGTTPVAWGMPCTATSACGATPGEGGFCSFGYGHPICIESCQNIPDYAACQGGNGICIPVDTTLSVCVPKCGDQANTTCGAGSSCAFVGYRQNTADMASGFSRVGGCFPDCQASGVDGCMGASRACDLTRRFCAPTDCNSACKTGSTCVNGTCTPSSPIALYGSCTPNATNANGCLSDLCATDGTNPGFCIKFCNTTDGQTACGAGGECWTDNNRDLANNTASGGTTGYPSV